MLHLYRAEQAGALVPALARMLAAAGQDDPFARQVVAVSARGVERWLAQRLSHHLGAEDGDDGVCANVVMPAPGDLVRQAMGAVHPADALHPWQPEPLTWQVLALLDAHHGEPWLADVSRHLGLDGDADTDDEALDVRRGRRFAFAQRTARRYDAYAAQRPGMLTAWRDGLDEDGTGRPLPGHQRWQADLWRLLREAVPGPDPVQLTEDAATVLAAEPDRSGLPAVLGVFGPSRLDARDLTVLLALARGHDVHLFLTHPSPQQWRTLAEHPTAATTRAEDTSAQLVRHPLLRHLGGDGREFQTQLTRALAGTDVLVGDEHRPAPARGRHLLGRLQDDLTADADLDATTPPAPGGAPDPSVQFHACHGPARQVEVLREVVTGLLQDDPTLEPRDILVMCPQIEDFAPRLLAVFGDPTGDDGDTSGHPGQRLRLRLADRSPRSTNPVLDVLATVLTLASSRRTRDELLDLLGTEPVRRRFGLDDDQLEKVRGWLEQAHVRWGLTAQDRDRFGLGDLPENTWHLGLDRLLLGVAMDGDGHRGRLSGYPLDGIDSTAVDLAGRITEFVHRLAGLLRHTTGAHPPAHWLGVLTRAVDTLTLAPGRDAWQQTAARAVLHDALATPGPAPALLRLADVHALLADRLAGRPTRSSFRTGDLTVCSLVPMRSVPHRVVVLLGMDTGVFPRSTHPDGDDLLAVDPLVGEQDAAGQERQILLDALLAARDHLVVLWSGADERTGDPRPPAVPVGELRDVARRSGHPLEVRHPLHPADPRQFTPGHLVPGRPFSFDRQALDGARARLRPRQEPPARLITRPLDPPPPHRLDLGDLRDLAGDPPAYFVRRVLTLSTFEEEPEGSRMPIALDGLARYHAGRRVLADLLSGHTEREAFTAEARRGALPPGRLGDGAVQEIRSAVDRMGAATAALRAQPVHQVGVDLDVDGQAVTGTVEPVHGRSLLVMRYSRLNPRTIMTGWVPLLALVARTGDPAWDAVLVTRGGGGAARHVLTVPDPESARTWLADLVALERLSRREPLPVPPRTARCYASRLRRGATTALAAARKEWEGGAMPERAGHVAATELWPGARLADLTALHPLSDPHWTPSGPSGWFGELATRIWAPVVACLREV